MASLGSFRNVLEIVRENEDGEDLVALVRPSAISPTMQKKMTTLSKAAENKKVSNKVREAATSDLLFTLAEVVTRQVESWNATYDAGHDLAGEPIPVTVDAIADLGLDEVVGLMEWIGESAGKGQES